MAVLPLSAIFEELQLTVTSAEVVLPSLKNDSEIMLSCEISSLPTHNCNMVFRKSDLNVAVIGQMSFRSIRPLVTAEMVLNFTNFEKMFACYGKNVRSKKTSLLHDLHAFLDVFIL